MHMDPMHFDRISKAFSRRLLSRRQILTHGGASLTAGALATAGLSSAAPAQEATPTTEESVPDADHGPTMLFVQTYQSGTIAPIEGAEGRYTLTLEQGHGQTVYFSDRPDRIVGASPTPQFLEGLGFPDDNPPNAALVVETAPGETDVAVVELFNPLYDPGTEGVTYEIEVLANWRASVELGFTEAPTDLAALAPSFGAAQLFIDDCPDGDILCHDGMGVSGRFKNSEHDGYCYSWSRWTCLPCQPWYDDYPKLIAYWTNRCNATFSLCNGTCRPLQLCSTGGVGRCQL